MSYFLTFWFGESWERFSASYFRSVQFFENNLAIMETARNITRPIFQDYTYQGRAIGIFLRCCRILAGLILYVLLSIGYGGLFLLWLALPFLCVVTLIGSIAGS